MRMNEISFGEFLMQKRRQSGISLRGFAERIGISPAYLCEIEKNRKSALSVELLLKITTELALTTRETEILLDLNAKARNTVSVDLRDYIMQKEVVRITLRSAKKHDIDDAKWLDFKERIVTDEQEGENDTDL